MAHMLELITDELKMISYAAAFYEYLERFVCREENGDKYNGFGGFIRSGENVMFDFDLRTFAPQNREFFWVAAQRALTKLKVNDSQNETIFFLTDLLDMHKRIRKGEDPMALNHMSIVVPDPLQKLGPGWGEIS